VTKSTGVSVRECAQRAENGTSNNGRRFLTHINSTLYQIRPAGLELGGADCRVPPTLPRLVRAVGTGSRGKVGHMGPRNIR
jgi:hypothetical protein